MATLFGLSLVSSRKSATQSPHGCDPDERRVPKAGDDVPAEGRWILVHMIEKTGRHAGHPDTLRGQIGSSTGR